MGMRGSVCMYTLPEIFFPVEYLLRSRHSLVLKEQISLCSDAYIREVKMNTNILTWLRAGDVSQE